MIKICAALKFEIITIACTAGWNSSGHVIGKFSGNTTLDPMMLAKAMAHESNSPQHIISFSWARFDDGTKLSLALITD